MANTLLVADAVAREASILLRNNTIAARLMSRGVESEFVGTPKKGASVRIRQRPTPTAVDLASGSTSASDQTETAITLTVDEQPYIRYDLTSEDLTFSVEDFNAQFTEPAMISIAQYVDAFALGLYDEVFNHVGQIGDPPDSLADLVAVVKKADDMQMPQRPRLAILDSQAKADALSIDNVIGADKRGDGGTAFRDAALGSHMGIDWFMDQNIKTHTAGTLDDGTDMSCITNSTPAVGATSMACDETALTGTVVKGDIFTVAGNTQQYAITAGATASGNAITLVFTPGLAAAPGDGAQVTFATVAAASHVANLLFHPNAFALAVIAPPAAVGAAASSTINFEGLGIRVTFGFSTSNMVTSVVYDTFIGGALINPGLATLILG